MISSLFKNWLNWLIFEDLGKGTSHFPPTLAAVKIFNSAENLLCCAILIISVSLWCKSSLPNSGLLASSESFLALLLNILLYFNMTDTTCFMLTNLTMLISYLLVSLSFVLISKVYSHFFLQFWVINWNLHIFFVLLLMFFQVAIKRMDHWTTFLLLFHSWCYSTANKGWSVVN